MPNISPARPNNEYSVLKNEKKSTGITDNSKFKSSVSATISHW